MTPAQSAQRLRQMQQRLRDGVVKAEADTAREAYQQARRLSGGPFSSADLAQMGHPYARRNPQPPADPALINIQSGRFEAAWQIRLPRWTATGLHTEIRNETPYAGYLDTGTQKMIARPLVQRVLDQAEPGRIKRLTAAIRRALT